MRVARPDSNVCLIVHIVRPSVLPEGCCIGTALVRRMR